MARDPKSFEKLSRLAKEPRTFIENLFPFAITKDLEDRAIAIMTATEVENAIQSAITSRLLRFDHDTVSGLFYGDRGPISSFSAKTKVAYAMGIITVLALLVTARGADEGAGEGLSRPAAPAEARRGSHCQAPVFFKLKLVWSRL